MMLSFCLKKIKKRKTTKNIYTKNKTRRKSKQTAAPSRQIIMSQLTKKFYHSLYTLSLFLTELERLQQGPVCHNPGFQGEPGSSCYPSCVTLQLEADDTAFRTSLDPSPQKQGSQCSMSPCPASKSLVTCVLPGGAQVHTYTHGVQTIHMWPSTQIAQ